MESEFRIEYPAFCPSRAWKTLGPDYLASGLPLTSNIALVMTDKEIRDYCTRSNVPMYIQSGRRMRNSSYVITGLAEFVFLHRCGMPGLQLFIPRMVNDRLEVIAYAMVVGLKVKCSKTEMMQARDLLHERYRDRIRRIIRHV